MDYKVYEDGMIALRLDPGDEIWKAFWLWRKKKTFRRLR